MIPRQQWVDEADAWHIIGREINSALVELLDATLNAAKASGKVRARDGENGIEVHADDLKNWLKRGRGRPLDTGLDAAGDMALAVLAVQLERDGTSPDMASAIREAIRRHRDAGIAVAGHGDERATVERIRKRANSLSR